MLGLVATGLGVSVVPEMAAVVDTSPDRVYRPFVAPVPTRKLCVVRHAQRYRPPAVSAFVEAIKAERPAEV